MKYNRLSILLLPASGHAALNPPAREGYEILRIDKNVWIDLTRDGEQMWVEAEKKGF